MSSISEQSKLGYALISAAASNDESQRLEELHRGIAEYLGQKLSLAPLEEMQPKMILELGSGSGAWAIDAAVQFPEASVIAVDISPMPSRPLPPNLQFIQADITQSLPVADASFDVVHARWVILHLCNVRETLPKIFQLVKPGGWLIIEDPNPDGIRAKGPLPPAFAEMRTAWLGILRSRGLEPDISEDLPMIAQRSGYFDVVNSRKLQVPLAESSQDEALNKLGFTYKTTTKRSMREVIDRGVLPANITEEVVQKWMEEIDDKDLGLTMDAYFLWARRRVD
ncbi:S-adenosyl-L-methionine-dependent methyltransferase [Amylostereum chailletii]|nr:S-adenosyl-L-methionine-dependent methyltransferase [Amylostereum chailletii]